MGQSNKKSSILKYIELDGKVPKHSFDIFSTDHTNYKDAGVILNTKLVVVDFDERSKAADVIFDTYPTLKVHTSRGFHLWYKRPTTEQISTPIRNYTGKLTVGGVKVDYKTGTKSQATIKQNGQLRKMENDHLLYDLDSLPELPLLLWPSKLKHDLLGLKEHQGRNSALYSHLLTSAEQYALDKETLETLAGFIDHYVFADPMGDEAMTVLQSVLEKKPVKKKEKYLDAKDMVMTSEVLTERLDIHYYSGRLFFKQKDRYITDDNKLLREIDQHIQLKPSNHKQLLDLFKIKASLVEDGDFPVMLPGGYVIDEGEVIQIDAGFTPYFLDARYDEQAYDKDVDDFLNFLAKGRKDLRTVIEEMLGHILMTKGFPHKVFFLYGPSAYNGKSTFIKMVKRFTDSLHTGVPLDKFDDDTSIYSLVGKLVNIADDINASYLDKSSNFKTLASGDPVMVRPIYSAATMVENRATLVFTCNEMPMFRDKSGGVARRIVVIPCDNKVTKKDIHIDEKLSTVNAKSYLLRLALEGAARIRGNGGHLTESETINQQTEEYFISSDSALSFLQNYDAEIEGKKTRDIYAMYVAYCEDEGLKASGSTEFGRRMKKAGWESKQKKIDGKNVRIYARDQSEE
ncbi:DNA primase [Domibacillus antri]|uniref:DNA primase n=1 Tax=Domibacillus antri TaxID=1714264 RepID=A0A1Q8Q281_9BACI|nr:phage/plasmid primase, P4 family [Domibacillus antri]OLN21415.1 DNA primase [Domibacillus antri]